MRITTYGFVLGALLLLLPTVARAQTVMSPTRLEFDDVDYAAVDGGQPVVTGYVLELWTPGTDTTGQTPPQQQSSAMIPKSQATQVAGAAVTRRTIPLAQWGLIVPQGPTFVATVRSVGPGGTARSAASNPFTVPIPVRAPNAVTNLHVQ